MGMNSWELSRQEALSGADAPSTAPPPPRRHPPATLPPTSGVTTSQNWGTLYQEHADFVWRSLQRMGVLKSEARDALHDVFLVVHSRLHTFDPSLGSTRSWLFGIAVNVARASHRKRKLVLVDSPEQLADSQEPRRAEHQGSGGSGTHAISTRRLRESIQSAVSSLDPERRAVFIMFELEGLECIAIADELGVPLGTVYSRLHSARKQLREALSAHRPAGESPDQ
jgi:RNA polymerase sigma-70 factor (ECF subfamily)